MIENPKILFVCTGNVFRSMTAEFACRAVAGDKYPYVFSSAGTRSRPDVAAWPYVTDYLNQIKLDVAGHAPRRLDLPVLAHANLVVAMNHDHKDWIEETFGRRCHLFMEIATGAAAAMPDITDLKPVPAKDSEEARRHIAQTIDLIVAQSNAFVERLPLYLG